MSKSTSHAVALLVVSLVLLNAFRLAPLLPSDLWRVWFVAVCTAGGVACLVMGAIRLLRSKP